MIPWEGGKSESKPQPDRPTKAPTHTQRTIQPETEGRMLLTRIHPRSSSISSSSRKRWWSSAGNARRQLIQTTILPSPAASPPVLVGRRYFWDTIFSSGSGSGSKRKRKDKSDSDEVPSIPRPKHRFEGEATERRVDPETGFYLAEPGDLAVAEGDWEHQAHLKPEEDYELPVPQEMEPYISLHTSGDRKAWSIMSSGYRSNPLGHSAWTRNCPGFPGDLEKFNPFLISLTANRHPVIGTIEPLGGLGVTFQEQILALARGLLEPTALDVGSCVRVQLPHTPRRVMVELALARNSMNITNDPSADVDAVIRLDEEGNIVVEPKDAAGELFQLLELVELGVKNSVQETVPNTSVIVKTPDLEITQRLLGVNSWFVGELMGLTDQDTVCFVPESFDENTSFEYLWAMVRGSRVIYADPAAAAAGAEGGGDSLGSVKQTVMEQRPTVLVGDSDFWRKVAAEPDLDLSSLRIGVVHDPRGVGSDIIKAMKLRLRELVVLGSLSPKIPLICFQTPLTTKSKLIRKVKPHRVGLIHPYMEARIVGENGETRGARKTGTLLLRWLEYPDIVDTWISTGIEGDIDSDGQLRLFRDTGRARRNPR